VSTNPPIQPLNLDDLRERLQRLGLYGLLANAETVINEPWLPQLLDIEETERTRRSFKRRLDDARIGVFKPVADFDWQWPTQCDRPLVEEILSLAFIEEAANIVLIGPNGLGKTMLMKNMLYQAVLHGPYRPLHARLRHAARSGCARLLGLARAPPATLHEPRRARG
jgi:DNA replication protein DnaC